MKTEHWLPEGSLLHEKYNIKKGLGQGGFAITYLAYDTTLQQEVAIKEYFPVRYANRLSSRLGNGGNNSSKESSQTTGTTAFQLSATSMVYPQTGQEEKYLEGMKNFLEEARLLFGKFDIEGIVSVKDFFEENGTVYIVMEYVSGMTLREYEKKKGKVSEAELYKLLQPIVKALSYLHSMGIVHCDISPDNLIFDKENNLKLIDFGAAKLGERQREEQKKEKEKDSQKETYYKGSYTPPEQYSDVKAIGPWTDIYALCAVWYELLTGNKVPTAIERMQKDKLKPVSTVMAVSPQIEEILHRGLSLEIPERYFCAVNLYFDIKKTEQLIKKTDKVSSQTDKTNGEIQTKEERKKEEQKTEAELEKYLKTTRKNWGDLWLQITTEVNERNITQKGKWLSKRRIKRGIQIAAVLMILVLLSGIGREAYIQQYPEKYFTYKIKKNKEYYLLHPRKNEYTNKQAGYDELVKNIRKLAYKADEEDGSIATYQLSENNIKKLKLISNEYDILYLSQEDLEKAVSIFMDLKNRDIEAVESEYENYIYKRGWAKRRKLEVNVQKKKIITYANKEKLSITYDPVDRSVYAITFLGNRQRVRKFVEKLQPILCPDNYLTSADCDYIFGKLRKGAYKNYQIGSNYELELADYDMEETGYLDYEVTIQAKTFRNIVI